MPPEAAEEQGEPGLAGAASPVGTPLLGRARELGELQAGLSGAQRGIGGLALISGEGGIGKTRLAEAFAERARQEGALPLWGRCWESGGAPPYWPWSQVLQALSRTRDDERLRPELGPGAAWVAQIAPELRDRLPDVEPPGSLESEQARFALFEAVARFLRNASQPAPLVIVLDDVHAADQPSLLLLEFLARSVRDAAIFIVATHREGGTAERSEAEGLLARLVREGRRLRLSGLDESDIARLVEQRGGIRPAAEFVQAVHAATDGNPFFTDEIMRLLAAEGRVDDATRAVRASLPLPDTVREAVARRFEPLSDAVREVLTTAAVIGREFRLATLERATGVDRGALLELLDEAVSSGLLVAVPGTVGVFRFAHVLIRDTLYEGMSAADRSRVHGLVGEALEQAYGAAVEPHLDELAHHFVAAAPRGDPGKALEYATRAGHRAMGLLGYEHAAELFESALLTLELERPGDDDQRGELLLARGRAELRAGHESARDTLNAVTDLARRVGSADLFGRAALELAGFGLSQGIVDEERTRVLEEALEFLGAGDSALRARVLARLAVALYWSDDVQRRRALVDEAVSMARRSDDPATLAEVLTNAHFAVRGPDTVEQTLDWTDELLAISRRLGDEELGLQARNTRIDLLLELGDLAAADMAMEDFDQIAERLHQPRAQWFTPFHRAMRALLEGRFAEAERLNAAGIAMGSRFQESMAPQIAAAQIFFLRWMQGRIGELEEVVRQFADRFPALRVWRCGLAMLYSQIGREAEARREFERLAAHEFADIPRDNVWMVAMALLSETCAYLDDAPRAARLYELLAPFASRNVVSPQVSFIGPASRYLGVLAGIRRDWDRAEEHFAAALETAERLGARPNLSLIRLERARMLVARDQVGDRSIASELLTAALPLARELGMTVAAERIEDLEQELARKPEPAAPAEPVAASPEEATLRREGPGQATLRRQGDMWVIALEGRGFHLRDSKGVHYLAALLERPGVEVPALELAGGAAEAERRPAAQAAAASGVGVAARPLAEEDAGPLLDPQAKAAYRARVEELREELEEAEAFNDPERAARAREEMEFIGRELAGAVGLGGRDRKAGSAAERARVNVTRAIRSTLRRISEHDEEIGRELEATVRTGTFCSYEPDPRRPLHWTVTA